MQMIANFFYIVAPILIFAMFVVPRDKTEIVARLMIMLGVIMLIAIYIVAFIMPIFGG